MTPLEANWQNAATEALKALEKLYHLQQAYKLKKVGADMRGTQLSATAKRIIALPLFEALTTVRIAKYNDIYEKEN